MNRLPLWGVGFFYGGCMTNEEHQKVIDELQVVIDDTQTTLKRFEDKGMNNEMPADYDKLLDILDNAIKQQREHTQAVLSN